MTSRCAPRQLERRRITSGGIVVALLVATLAGCTRADPSGTDPTPTMILQPTPDPTMHAIINGMGSPVAFLPPLDAKASPTAAPVVNRPAPAPAPVSKPAAPRPTSAPARREPAPAPRTAPTAAPPRPAPTAARPTPPSAAPAIINPTTVLPGGTRR